MVLFSGKLFHEENALPAVGFNLRLAMTTKYRVFGCFFFFFLMVTTTILLFQAAYKAQLYSWNSTGYNPFLSSFLLQTALKL